MARYFRRRSSIMPRRKRKWIWIRESVNDPAPASGTLSTTDLLSTFRTHGGITINLPELTIWRIKLRISITISLAATVNENDGVLATVFVDSLNQTMLNQLTNPFDEKDMIYSMMYATKTLSQSTGNSTGAQTNVCLYEEYDIKARRRLRAIDDTLWLQFASSGQASVTGWSYSAAILCSP